MKKKIIAALCVALLILSAVGVAGIRFIRSERKTDSENYLLAAKNAAYEIGEYIETGDENSFSFAAADIIQMNNMTSSASSVVSPDNAEIIENAATVLSYNPLKLSCEAERLRTALEIIAENGEDVDYAYAQIQIALTNSDLLNNKQYS